MARTIDNLGVEISTRYAEDQKQLDQTIIKEARAIPSQTHVEVLVPSYTSELEQLFGLERRNITWAFFYAPAKYSDQKGQLFSYQIIPSLGSDDLKEAQAQKIKANVQAKSEKRKKEEEKEEGQKKSLRWEEKRKEEEEREEKILLKLLSSITMLDRYLVDVNSRRTQYQKG